MVRRPAQPGLYSTDVEAGSLPRLKGGRCVACGFVFFPPQSFGCERCGAPPDQLEETELEAVGRLDSLATVHLHQGGGVEAPFTVGEIVLEAGPMVRALLVPGEHPAIGERVGGVLFPVAKEPDGDEKVELRFGPLGGAAEERS